MVLWCDDAVHALIMSSGCAFVALPFGRALFFSVISRRVDFVAGHRLREVRGLNHERVPNSTAGYTWTQLRDRFIAPIWHPGDHRPLPDIVANGRKPDVFACGFCHRADGPGGPENADLAGLPKSYIIRQMTDYKNGARGTSVPGRLPPSLMIGLSKAITDEEVQTAAAYFSALQPRKRIKVVESDTAPKSYIAGLLWAAVEGSEREPLGQRILELPDNLQVFESRDPRSTFTAYVPVGSLAKGEALVTKGSPGKTVACAPCHG
jgi:cytochrome c553